MCILYKFVINYDFSNLDPAMNVYSFFRGHRLLLLAEMKGNKVYFGLVTFLGEGVNLPPRRCHEGVSCKKNTRAGSTQISGLRGDQKP